MMNLWKLSSIVQEAVFRDVEQPFGVLQAHFGIIRGPSRIWKPLVLFWMMNAFVILHNIMIEDQEHEDLEAALISEHEEHPSRVPHMQANFRCFILELLPYCDSDAHY